MINTDIINNNINISNVNNGYIFTNEYIQSPYGSKLFFKTKGFQHQIDCLKKFSDYKGYALLCEMGSGKSWIIINNFAYLALKREVDNLLIFAPNGVQFSWVDNEFKTHMSDQIKYKAFAYNGSLSNKKQLELLKFIADPLIKHKILCVNWQALSNAKGVNIIQKFCENSSKLMLVLDESHNIKDPTTKRFKALEDLQAHAKYKRIMSGTPITNSPFDAFTQFNFLDENILNCKSFISFKHRYGVFLPKNSPLVQSIINRGRAKNVLIPVVKNGVPLYKDLDKLQALIRPYSFRVLKKDCLDLPNKMYKNEYIELTPTQQKFYKHLKSDGLALLKDDTVAITNKIVILTKLCQVASNNFLKEDGSNEIIDAKHNPKLERTIEIIKECVENKQSVVLWGHFKSELEDLRSALEKENITYVRFYGGVSNDERIQAVSDFQSGKASVFLSNVQSGSTGLTLTKANTMIYYSNTFSVSDRVQSEDRIHRIGQKSNVLYINMIAKDTIDEHIIQVLENKIKTASDIMNFSDKELIKGVIDKL